MGRWAYEARWQDCWEKAGLHRAQRRVGRNKWFVVELPPYANGQLHMGHVRNYTIGDVIARYRRKLGYDVLYTTGFDAFGLPIETAARDAGVPPYDLVAENMITMSRTFRRLGYSHDTSLTISDHEPRYFRWVQWVFLQLHKAGLIYRKRGRVNWCADCRTTLAENLVDDGRCWRCKNEVETVLMDRWFIREIDLARAVAERPDPQGWPGQVLKIHRDWIGLKRGYEARFAVFEPGAIGPIAHCYVFVSNPAEFRSARAIAIPKDHEAFWEAKSSSSLTAVSTCGKIALPVEVSDDLREDQFGACVIGSTKGDLHFEVPADLRETVRTRLREWDIARPRAWGTPVPMVICESCGAVPVPPSELPVRLPERFDNSSSNPLTEIAAFRHASCAACGGPAERETDTLEAYSSPWWFYLIASRPEADDIFRSPGVTDWMPVDTMIGGVDQARTCYFHLRTMTAALNLIGATDETDPVRTLLAVGMVKLDNVKMSKSAGNGIDPADLLERFGADALRVSILWAAAPDQDLQWSDDLIRKGASLLKKVRQFCTAQGAAFDAMRSDPNPQTRQARQVIGWVDAADRTVRSCMEKNAFHFAITQISRLTDSLAKAAGSGNRDGDLYPVLAHGAGRILHLLSPFAPHLAEELWASGGGSGMIAALPFPAIDRTLARDSA